jgi:hypothetical protein
MDAVAFLKATNRPSRRELPSPGRAARAWITFWRICVDSVDHGTMFSKRMSPWVTRTLPPAN